MAQVFKTEGTGRLSIEREFDAPRRLVWRFWTEPELLKRWWGPVEFTTPSAEMDVRVGGKALIAMRSPSGEDVWSTGTYKEIVPEKRLVMTDSFADAKGNIVNASYYKMPGIWPDELLVTVDLAEVGGRTRMRLEHTGMPDDEMATQTRLGWMSSFDKLDMELRKEQAFAAEGKTTFTFISDLDILITRVFDAPRELVFASLADPVALPEWWGPGRYTTKVERMDVRPGGTWRFIQKDEEGKEYAFHGEYREVVKPSLIVQTFVWEGMPDKMIVETQRLEALDGKTKISSTEHFQSKEDRDGMWQTGMQEGSSESMDRFAALLRKRKGR
jgi:uncharacterized protein YndB with AHSA1/START domain